MLLLLAQGGALQMRQQWLLLMWRRAAVCAGARVRSVQHAQEMLPSLQASAANAATVALPGLSSK
jgi:hypothetical protein